MRSGRHDGGRPARASTRPDRAAVSGARGLRAAGGAPAAALARGPGPAGAGHRPAACGGRGLGAPGAADLFAAGRSGCRLPTAAGGRRLAATGRPALALHAARAAPGLHGRRAVVGGRCGGDLSGGARGWVECGWRLAAALGAGRAGGGGRSRARPDRFHPEPAGAAVPDAPDTGHSAGSMRRAWRGDRAALSLRRQRAVRAAGAQCGPDTTAAPPRRPGSGIPRGARPDRAGAQAPARRTRPAAERPAAGAAGVSGRPAGRAAEPRAGQQLPLPGFQPGRSGDR